VKKAALLAGESLRDSTIRERSGATVLAIRRGDDVVANPDPVWELQEGDTVLLLGSREQLAVAGKLFEPQAQV
jgi:CPA2 family monovalent cation:H+ antiporter-2